MTNEEILATVPKGCNGMGKVEGESEWVPMHNSMGIVRSVDDIRRIVELEKEVKKWQKWHLETSQTLSEVCGKAEIAERKLKAYEKEAIEAAKGQEVFATNRIIEAFETNRIPRHAKAGCIGEFKFSIEDGVCCPQCWEQQDDDCDLCGGKSNESGYSDLKVTVPWDLCKSIWLAMNKIKAEELRQQLNGGE